MNTLQKIELGSILTLFLAVIGFVFWLGGLAQKVDELNSTQKIDEAKTDAIAEITDAAQGVLMSNFPRGVILAWSDRDVRNSNRMGDL